MPPDDVDLEYFTFTHPRRSSDFCFAAESPAEGPLGAVYGVTDMIGRPRRLTWRNYMRTAQRQMQQRMDRERPGTLPGLVGTLRDELLRHNGIIGELRRQHDREAFGFCSCFAAVHGKRCRVLWLGDCRAYRIRRHPRPKPGQSPFSVRCLTRDQNELGALVEKQEEVALFRNDLLSLGRHLVCYLGCDEEARVRGQLEEHVADTVLTDDDCLLLATDGFYLPLARAMLDVTNFRLSRASYYLETWMENLLAVTADLGPRRRQATWEQLAGVLVEHALRQGRRHKLYRDDMAVFGLHLPARAARPPEAKQGGRRLTA